MTVRARVSLGALRANLERASARGGVVDARADGWGHGALTVARAAASAGAAAVVVDDDQHAELVASGLPAELLIAAGPESIDPSVVFGVDGDGTPVLRLSGSVISTKPLREGEGVSYGYLHRAPSNTRVALVSGGYAQGVLRALGGRAAVVVGDRRCAILGRVAMDVCVVDIGDAAVLRGDDAWFFGDPAEGHPSIREWADATGLRSLELVAAVGLHVERVTA